MKITDKTKTIQMEYGEVKVGVVFKYMDEYYITIEEIDDDDKNSYNCVNLYNGELCYFNYSTIVEVPNAELVIS